MNCWLFLHRELRRGAPEVAEVFRFWSAVYEGRRLAKPDLIIPRTGSETNYFTLAVLRHFERQGVAMVNSPSAVEAVADKLQTLQILSAAGLPIPKTLLAKFPVDVDLVEREIGFPVVVKTLRGTRGEGVLLCSSREQFHDLANLLDGARTDDGYRICEANSAPGFQGLETACAISVPDAIFDAARARLGLPGARPNSWRRLLNAIRATLSSPAGSRPRRLPAAN